MQHLVQPFIGHPGPEELHGDTGWVRHRTVDGYGSTHILGPLPNGGLVRAILRRPFPRLVWGNPVITYPT